MTYRLPFAFAPFAFALSAAVAPAVAEETPPPGPPKVTYDDDVKAIFRSKCANCHNTDKKVAGLDLTSFSSMMQGGGSGAAVEPGDPSTSYLWMVVAHETEPYMPPNSPRMDDASLAVIREWIELGAPENKGSKVAKKKSVDLKLSGAPTGKPDGPPPMPPRLPLEPIRHTPRAAAVTALAASPWSPLVAVGGFNQVVLYHSQSLDPVGVLPFPEGVPTVLRFSRNGKLLLAAGGRGAYQGLAVVWDVTTGQRIAEVGDETDAVLAADISPDQSLVALGGPSRKVKVYSTTTGELVYEIKKHTEWVYALEFSPDGVLLATADRNGGLHVWEAMTGQEFLVLDGHKTAVNAVSWRPDGNLLASCDDEGKVRLWELENGKSVKDWAAHPGGAKSVEFTRDGRLVTCGVDKTAKLYDANGAEQKKFPPFADVALRATYAAEGDRVIAGDWTGEIRVWNPADAAQVGALTANPPTLQTRIDQAAAAVAAVKAKQDAAAAAVAAAEAAAKQADEAVAAAKVESDSTQSVKSDTEKKAAELEARAKALKDEQAKATEAAKGHDAALPSLKAAVDQAREAAGKEGAGDDAKKALEAAEAAVAERTKQLEEARAAEKKAADEIAAAGKEAEAAKNAAAEAGKRIEELKKRHADAEAAAKAKQDELAKARQAMTDAQAATAAAEAAAQRWRDELAFARQADTARAAANP